MRQFYFGLVFTMLLGTAASVNAASWSCQAKCSGSFTKVVGMLPGQATPGESSDFKANCTQVLGGTLGTTSPGYCGAYYYCYKYGTTTLSVSGTGDGLIAARQAARSQCESANFDNHAGNGCPYDYTKYFLDENSLSCSQ